MVEEAKSWMRDNATLIYFLIGQAIFIGGLAFTGVSYMVTLENRVTTLEVRGSPHLAEINTRLTTTEKETQANNERIDRIVDVLTRELGKPIK